MNIRICILPLVWAVLCVFPSGGGAATLSSSGRQEAGFLTPPAIEEGILAALNRERDRNGRPPLGSLVVLAEVARAHSREMAAVSRLFHVSESERPLADRLAAAGLFFVKAGENVARSDSFLPALIHQALLESPPHRENMLDADYDAAGVGVVSVDNRTYYVTQVFLRSIRPPGQDEAVAEIKRQTNEIRRAAGLPPLVFWEEADRFADMMLLSRSLGAQATEPPARFGAVKGFFSESPFLAFEDKAASEIAKPLYARAGLAVNFRRTKANPGGAYLLALLLMSENQPDRPEADLVTPALREEARRASSALDGEGDKGKPISMFVSGHRAMTYITFDRPSFPSRSKAGSSRPDCASSGSGPLFRGRTIIPWASSGWYSSTALFKPH